MVDFLGLFTRALRNQGAEDEGQIEPRLAMPVHDDGHTTRLDVLAAAIALHSFDDWRRLTEETRGLWRDHARPILLDMDAQDPLRVVRGSLTLAQIALARGSLNGPERFAAFGIPQTADVDAATGCADDALPGTADQWRAAVDRGLYVGLRRTPQADECPSCAGPTAAVFGGPPHCPLPDCAAPADLYRDVSADALAAERAADETFEHAPVVRAAANGRRTSQQIMDAWLNASRLEASTHAELCAALAAGDAAFQ
jgi:hypothetical protein